MAGPRKLRVLPALENAAHASLLSVYFRERPDVVELPVTHHRGEDLRHSIETLHPDLLLLETKSPGKPISSLRQDFPRLCIVAIAPSLPEIAFEAAKSGAGELITLPLDPSVFGPKLDAILDDLHRADHAHPVSETNPEHTPAAPNLFSSSPRMQEILDTIDKVATTSATVLVRGESGVGKEIAARMIFARSRRSHKPFIKVNCAAIPNELLESELFGYEAGAFTGAQRPKPGKFELAHTGTLFLDEVGEMHPVLQAKLLHVLQDGVFARLGAKHDTAVDVRVVCATNKLLEQRVSEGLFREDLFYRINVVTVHIPPLRERRDEIPRLIDYFLMRYAAAYARPVVPFTDEVMQFLMEYWWPGNIRELENLCKRYVIVGGATQIVYELSQHMKERQAETAPLEITPDPLSSANGASHADSAPSLLEIGRRAAWLAEKQAIRQMLMDTRWNRREASRRLNVSYKALLNKIRVMEEEEGNLKIQ